MGDWTVRGLKEIGAKGMMQSLLGFALPPGPFETGSAPPRSETGEPALKSDTRERIKKRTSNFAVVCFTTKRPLLLRFPRQVPIGC